MKKLAVAVFILAAIMVPIAAFADDGSDPKKDTPAPAPSAASAPAKSPAPAAAPAPAAPAATPAPAPAPAAKDATKAQPAAGAAPVAKDQSKDQSKEPEKKKSKDEQKEQIRQVQVGIRKLAEKLADAIMALPDGKYAQVAVLTFQETGKLTKDKELGTLVAAELMTYLHKEHGLYIVERDKLDKVIKELQVQQSGLVDDNTASKIGKMVAAQALILGTVSEAGASFIVNARVVSVETAKVMVADNVSFPASGMVSLSKNAVELKSKWGAVYRSLVVPGWGQIYNNQEIKGGIYLGVTVAFFTTAIVFEVEGNQLVDDYKKATDPNAIKNIKKNIEDKYQIRNIAIYCGIAMWAINIIDAAVFGYDASKAIAKVPVLKDAKLALGAGGGMLSWGQEF